MNNSKNNALQKSIEELGIKVRLGDEADLEELDRLLTFTLYYPSLEEAMIHHRANNIGVNDLLSKQA
jgi:hypothetical protein